MAQVNLISVHFQHFTLLPNGWFELVLSYFYFFFSSFESVPANEGLGLVLSFLHQPNPSNPVQAQ